MRGNVLALESLVGDLFLLARADSGNLALSREALDLADLTDGAVEAVAPMASARLRTQHRITTARTTTMTGYVIWATWMMITIRLPMTMTIAR